MSKLLKELEYYKEAIAKRFEGGGILKKYTLEMEGEKEFRDGMNLAFPKFREIEQFIAVTGDGSCFRAGVVLFVEQVLANLTTKANIQEDSRVSDGILFVRRRISDFCEDLYDMSELHGDE